MVGVFLPRKEKIRGWVPGFLRISGGIPKGLPLVGDERKVRAANAAGPLLSGVAEGFKGHP